MDERSAERAEMVSGRRR